MNNIEGKNLYPQVKQLIVQLSTVSLPQSGAVHFTKLCQNVNSQRIGES